MTRRKWTPGFLLALFLLPLILSLQGVTEEARIVSMSDFYDRYPGLVLVYPTLSLYPASASKILAEIESYAAFLRKWGPVEVVKDTDFRVEDTASKGVLLIGTEHSNAFLSGISSALPAHCRPGKLTLGRRSWNGPGLGAIFLQPLEERFAVVFYLPDLDFLERIRDVFHGPTGFVVFDHIAFSGDPDGSLATGFFQTSTIPWEIDENRLEIRSPIDGMALVMGTGTAPTSLARGDVLVSLDGREIMASNFNFTLEKLEGGRKLPARVLRDGKIVDLTVSADDCQSSDWNFLPCEVPPVPAATADAEFLRLRGVFSEAYVDPLDLMASMTFPEGILTSGKLPTDTGTSLLDFYKRLARFASTFHDGHIYIDTGKMRSLLDTEVLLKGGKLFPFQPIISGSRLFVPENSQGITEGSEIVSINGNPVSEILRQMAEYSTGDTFFQRLSEFGTEGFSDYFYLAFGEAPQFQIGLKAASRSLAVTLPAVPLLSRENRAKPHDSAPCGEIASGLYLLRIDSFGGGKDFSTLIEEAFWKLENGKIPNLVIDLRNNGGGSTDALCELFSHLVDHDFRIYKMSRARRSRLAEATGVEFDDSAEYGKRTQYQVKSTFPGGTDVYKGRLFVLVGPRTFSTAFDCAAMLRELRGAILVGEAPGGVMIQSGSHFRIPVLDRGMFITVPYKDFLPNLNILKDYSSTSPTHVLEPDHRVLATSETIRRHVDPCLAFLRSFLAKEKKFRDLHRE